jgi:hypothetical protein
MVAPVYLYTGNVEVDDTSLPYFALVLNRVCEGTSFCRVIPLLEPTLEPRIVLQARIL